MSDQVEYAVDCDDPSHVRINFPSLEAARRYMCDFACHPRVVSRRVSEWEPVDEGASRD